uniref:Uncharacterized protein n=1 Tax=Ciona savignyi TaxID=51511 RepID=H2ZHZ8_CIOSA
MINLSDVQKEILILLLIALGVSLIILFVSYIIWKNFCEPKLDEGRRNRQEQQDPFSVQLDTGDGESSALRSPDGARGEGTVSDIRYHRVLPIYPPLSK